jgi:hypothetical protein
VKVAILNNYIITPATTLPQEKSHQPPLVDRIKMYLKQNDLTKEFGWKNHVVSQGRDGRIILK